jgi:hypothetical protein
MYVSRHPSLTSPLHLYEEGCTQLEIQHHLQSPLGF